MSIPTTDKEPFKTKDDKMTTGSEKCLKFALKLESPGFFENSHWIWTCHWRRWILVMSGTPAMPKLFFQAWSKELNKQLLSEGQVPPQVGKEIASASFLKPLSDVSVPQFFSPRISVAVTDSPQHACELHGERNLQMKANLLKFPSAAFLKVCRLRTWIQSISVGSAAERSVDFRRN